MYLEVVFIEENKAKERAAHTPLVPDIICNESKPNVKVTFEA